MKAIGFQYYSLTELPVLRRYRVGQKAQIKGYYYEYLLYKTSLLKFTLGGILGRNE